MKSQNFYQEYFETDFNKLLNTPEDDVQYLEQNHFGDLLVEQTEYKGECFKLWRNLDCNVAQGEDLVQVEYCGKDNGYRWETVLTLNN
jgi:hypothetical protein